MKFELQRGVIVIDAAVIFDLDGTLLYTLEDIKDALNRTLKKYDLPGVGIEEVRKNIGNGSRVLLIKSTPSSISDNEVDDMLKDYLADYAENCNVKTKPYAGITDAIVAIRNKGYRVAVVSNKPDDATKSLVRTYFGGLVDVAVGETKEIKRKPAPDTINKVIKDLGIDKKASYYVGDSEVDIEASKNADIRCLSVSWGFRSSEQLKKAGAVEIIDSPEELVDKVINN